nr:hypothetical protein [uncultured Shewanella sp.]
MSDYQDLCEMYGREASDPEFIDDLVDEVSRDSDLDEDDYDWYEENENKDHHDLLTEQLDSVDQILNLTVPGDAKFSFLVMIHAHVVSAIEGYLAGVFIHLVCNSEVLTRKLIESDPEFSKRKFTLREIYQEQDALKVTVASYLKGLIFHDLKKIQPMYKSVLGYELSNLSWLFKAVELRHHCVHRAGYDKEGNKIDLSVESVSGLFMQVHKLGEDINEAIKNIR